MKAAHDEASSEVGKVNKDLGDAFLAENKKIEGVNVTTSGLQYRVLETGTGATPEATSTVETNYEGTLINGTVFDSSYQRGESVSFPVNGVIPGWTEALQLMKEGDVWELVIPSELAYGAQGAGGVIEPYATLKFKIELIKVK
jgi:FKBP-type peptidyl-prolyl cis-trans isomerase FklB